MIFVSIYVRYWLYLKMYQREYDRLLWIQDENWINRARACYEYGLTSKRVELRSN